VSAVTLDLFAGPGGWDVGADLAGICDVAGIEIDAAACRTARRYGHERHHGDVAALNPREIAAGWGDVGGLIASPPCQGFSIAGEGKSRDDSQLLLDGLAWLNPTTDAVAAFVEELRAFMSDPRTALVLEPLRWVLAVRPLWVAWEQVPTVQPIWDECADMLRAIGYTVTTGVLDAVTFGVPQVRRRSILVARDAASSKRFGPATMPTPTHSRFYAAEPDRLDPGVLPWVSMADALTWGMTARPYVTVAVGTAAGGTDPQVLGGSGARATVQREIDAGRWVPKFNDQSGTPFDPTWPEKRPATTVAGRGIVQNPGVTANRFNGSTKSRNDGVRVSVAEAGVLQSFPADYPWRGTRTKRFQQVGDAMPPLFARAVLDAARVPS
jgi:DNA (cytosine-5)-methyltransferase 1